MPKCIFLGTGNRLTDKKLGIRQFQIFIDKDQLPQHVDDALKANPVLNRYFMDWETFITRRPPGSIPKSNIVEQPEPSGPPIAEQHIGLSKTIKAVR